MIVYLARVALAWARLSVSWILGMGIFHSLGGGAGGFYRAMEVLSIFSLVVVLLAALYDFTQRRKIMRQYGITDLKLVQTREGTIRGKLTDILDSASLIVGMYATLGGPTVETSEDNGPPTIRIVAKRAGSPSLRWHTRGERLELTLQESTVEVRVTITSRPISRWTAFDLGRNIENVEEICAKLQMSVAPIGAPRPA